MIELAIFTLVLISLIDANNGVDEIIEEQRPFAIKHKVSFADLYVHQEVFILSDTHCALASNLQALSVSRTAAAARVFSSWQVVRTSLAQPPT